MKTSSFIASKSQIDCPVNPLIFNDGHGLSASDNWSIQNYEITTAHSHTFSTGAGPANRHLPTGSDMLSILETPTSCSGYKIMLPTGTTLTLDSDYNYFVVIYSTEDFTTANLATHSRKSHIGKITEQIQFDSVNDGIEFSPKRTTPITKGTKFAIYKGTLKSNTNISAVAYGLLANDAQGDWAYSKRSIVAKPNFYFFNDNLKISNQLDYSSKYRLDRLQYNSSTEDTSISYFSTVQNLGGRVYDVSPYTYTAKLVDNLKNADTDIQVGVANASLIDGSSHLNNSTYTPSHESGWDNIHKNMFRSTTDNTSNLRGAKRYIEYVASPEKSNAIPYITDLSIKKSVGKLGSFGELSIIDTSKIMSEKINTYDDFKVKQYIFKEEFGNDFKAQMPGLATISGNNIRITHLEKEDELAYATGNEIVAGAGGTALVRVKDYIYKLGTIPSLSLNASENYYQADLPVVNYKHINDKFWSAVGTVPDSFTEVNWFREKWSYRLQNIKVDFDVNADLKSLLEITLRGGDLTGLTFSVDSASSSNKTIMLSDLPTDNYNGDALKFLDYFTGSIYVTKTIFDGSVEQMNNKINESGQLIYNIKGRDDIHKLLGPIINKTYLHAEDFVYSTESPIQDITVTDVKLRSSTSGSAAGIIAGDTQAEVVSGSNHTVWDDTSNGYGKKLYTSDGRFIAIIRGISGSTITFEEPARCSYPKTSFIWSNSVENVISGLSINNYINASKGARNISTAMGKGMCFTYGKTLSAYGTSTSVNFLNAAGAKYNLGYDINKVTNLNSDNPFTFRLALEGSSTTYHTLNTISTLTNYDLISSDDKNSDTITTLVVAPISPFVLGRIDDATYDTRFSNNQGLYLINKQSLLDGGLINLVDSKTHTASNSKKAISIDRNENNIFGSPLFRYSDLSHSSNLYYNKPIGVGLEVDKAVNVKLTQKVYAANKPRGVYYATTFKFKEGIINDTPVIYTPFAEYSNILAGTLKSSLTDGTQTMLVKPKETRGTTSVIGSNFSDFNYYHAARHGSFPYKYGLHYIFHITPLQLNNWFEHGLHSKDEAGERTSYLKVGDQVNDNMNDSKGPLFGASAESNSYDNPYETVSSAKWNFEAFDPKAVHYHIFGPCDIFNDSVNNRNHIGYSGNSFEYSDFGIVGIGKGDKINNTTTHLNYIGGSTSTERDNKKYDIANILESSETPSSMKRFSLGRLVEVTFDMHFNSFCSEEMTNDRIFFAGESDKEYYQTHRMVEKTPIQVTQNVLAGATKVHVTRADWFNTYSTFLGSTAATNRSGQMDMIFNNNGKFICIVNTTHQGVGVAGETLSISSNTSDGTNGTHNGVATTSNGSGSGMTVNVVVSSGAVTSVTINAVGSNYEVGDTITIASSTALGGSTNVVTTIGSGDIETYITPVINSSGTPLIVMTQHTINSTQTPIITIPANTTGTIGTASVGSTYIYGIRLVSDGNSDTAKDTFYQPFTARFELGGLDEHYVPNVGLRRDTIRSFRDNRQLFATFNVELRFTRVEHFKNNHQAMTDGVLQSFNELGRNHGRGDDNDFSITDLSTYSPAYVNYTSAGTAMGDNGHYRYWSFVDNNKGRLYLPFAFKSWVMTHETSYKGNQATGADLVRGRHYTPWFHSYYYQKDEESTADFISEISGEFTAVENAPSGAGIPKTSDRFTATDHTLYDVGNKLYFFEGDSTAKPVFIGVVQSAASGSNGIVLTANTTYDVPANQPIKSFRGTILHQWHTSRLFQFMSNDCLKITKYGMKNQHITSNVSYLMGNEGGVYSSGNFTMLQKKPFNMASGSPINTGSSFSLRYNKVGDLDHYMEWPSDGNLVYNVGNSDADTVTLFSSYQSDVFARSIKEGGTSNSDLTDQDVGWSMPILSMNPIFSPHMHTLDLQRANDYNMHADYRRGAANQSFNGLFAFKPHMILLSAGTNVTISSADADYSTEEYNRVDNADIRKITLDFSTVGLLNTWINFSPNLTGYYLVSNLSSGEDAPSVNDLKYPTVGTGSWGTQAFGSQGNQLPDYYLPTYIHQILKHEVTYASTGEMIHNLWIDNATNIDDNLRGYRVMRWAENCTYDYSPTRLPLYALSNKTTKKPFENKMYEDVPRINMGKGVMKSKYKDKFSVEAYQLDGETSEGYSGGLSGANEGVLSMYVIVDAEPETSEYTVLRNIGELVASNKKLQVDTPYSFYVNDSVTKYLTDISFYEETNIGASSITFADLSEVKNTKGLVSYGKTLTLKVPKSFDVSTKEYLKIGTTFNIGQTAENIINDLMESNNITYTKRATDNKYILTPSFTGIDLYNALIYTSNYMGQEPRVIGKNIKFRDLDDSNDLVDIKIKEGISQVSITDSSTSMFELFNKVTVYGDGIKSVKKNSKSIKEVGVKALEETDTNLKSEFEVGERAGNLLKTHSGKNIQVEMQIGESGIEYLEVGNVIEVDYPSENIPVGRYMVLQVHHSIGKLPKYTLGLYSTNLDFKIAEILNAGRKVSAQIRGTEFEEVVEIAELISNVQIRELEIQVDEVVGSSSTTVFGLTNTFGFDKQFGFTSATGSQQTLYRKDLQQ